MRVETRKVLVGIAFSIMMIGIAFVPLSSPENYIVSPQARGGDNNCADDSCKLPFQGSEDLYTDIRSTNDPPSTGSRNATSNKYAVLVGISDYPGTGSDLQYCDDDVYQTRDKLIAIGWSNANIHTLIDSQGTNQNILDEIAWMKGQEDANSQVYFHFSGHGNSGYFVTYGDTMTDDTLAGAFTGFESMQKVIVMDTCFAGSFTPLDLPGTISLLACSSNELSYDGMFTPTFIGKMTDATVSVEKAFGQAKTSVAQQTGNSQNPVMWDNVPGDLLLGNMRPLIGSIPSPSAEEDNPIIMDLTAYESDPEDSGTDLDWLVTAYDAGIITSLTGERSDDDVITLYPAEDFTGTTIIELTLMDSMGQSTKKTVPITWTPVNDPPTAASIDRTTSALKRTQSLNFKLFGEDVDDLPNQVKAEIEVSPEGTDTWAPTSASQPVSGHWETVWTPEISDELGMYDVRARLIDNAGLTSDWVVRTSLIEVNNNIPFIDSIIIPTNSVERTGNITISIYSEDVEDDSNELTVYLEYLPPGGTYLSTGSAVFIDDHWDVDFHPGIGSPLGWYDIRAKAKDTDLDDSIWFYENGSIEVQNSKPIVTSIAPEEAKVYRSSSINIEVDGWDPEDSNVNLMAEIQYSALGGEWMEIAYPVEFSSNHWWTVFEPEIGFEPGDYSLRARLIDTAGAISEWYVLSEGVEVMNNLPTVDTLKTTTSTIERMTDLTIEVNANEIEDPLYNLTPEVEMTLKGKDSWSSSIVSKVEWSGSKDRWVVTVSPNAHATPGDYDLRVRFTDLDEGTGEWTLLDNGLKIINGPPVCDLAYPELINEKQDITFDASSSYDPEGGAMQYSWDFGDGESGSGDTIVHRFKKHGVYDLTLTVEDMDGAVVTDIVKLDVNGIPIASASADQDTGINNFLVMFSSDGSSDPDGKIVSYRWDFDIEKDSNGDGDPTNDIDSTDKNPKFDYGKEGTYNYKLVVVDDKGATVKKVNDISVSSMSAMTVGLIGGISLIIVVAALAALLLIKRKRKGGRSSNATDKVASIDGPEEPQSKSYSLLDSENENLNK